MYSLLQQNELTSDGLSRYQNSNAITMGTVSKENTTILR